MEVLGGDVRHVSMWASTRWRSAAASSRMRSRPIRRLAFVLRMVHAACARVRSPNSSSGRSGKRIRDSVGNVNVGGIVYMRLLGKEKTAYYII